MTTYYYRVTLFITTFKDNNPHFEHTEIFSGDNLGESRKAAIEYYNQQSEAVKTKGTFFGKDITGPTEFNYDTNAAHSLTLELVECTGGEPEEIGYYLCGYEGEPDTSNNRELERLIFQDMGLNWKPLKTTDNL